MVLTISELIEKRQGMGISQAELANVIGIFPSNISRIESGKFDCKISTLELMDAGLELIIKTERWDDAGVVVLDTLDYKNHLFKSIIPEIDKRADEGMYLGNAKDLAVTLVDLIVTGLGVEDEIRGES